MVGRLESNAKLNSKLKFEVKLKLKLELSLAKSIFALKKDKLISGVWDGISVIYKIQICLKN